MGVGRRNKEASGREMGTGAGAEDSRCQQARVSSGRKANALWSVGTVCEGPTVCPAVKCCTHFTVEDTEALRGVLTLDTETPNFKPRPV